MSAWIVVFLTQAVSVMKRRRGWHRRIGSAGAALAAAIVVVGSLTVASAIEKRFPEIPTPQHLPNCH